MTLTPRSTEQPKDQDEPQPKRPTLHKETIRDLDPDTSQGEEIKGGGRPKTTVCTAAVSGC
ncbi:MAG: hypothetical protein ACYDHH_00810 [Solirubrobacteraceae bacterium]